MKIKSFIYEGTTGSNQESVVVVMSSYQSKKMLKRFVGGTSVWYPKPKNPPFDLRIGILVGLISMRRYPNKDNQILVKPSAPSTELEFKLDDRQILHIMKMHGEYKAEFLYQQKFAWRPLQRKSIASILYAMAESSLEFMPWKNLPSNKDLEGPGKVFSHLVKETI